MIDKRLPSGELLVYTCITGDYDRLLPPVFTTDGIRYVCFTNRFDVDVCGWDIRPVASSMSGIRPNLINRRYKFFPWDFLPEHEWSLYVDGNARILSDPRSLIGDSEESGIQFLASAHPKRTTIREELNECISRGIIHGPAIEIAEERLALYFAEGFKDANSLTDNSIIFRSGDPTRVRPVMEMWWEELNYFSGRDQISLPYVIWKSGLPTRVLSVSSRLPNKYFGVVEHSKGAASWAGYVAERRYHGLWWGRAHVVISTPKILLKRSLVRMDRFRRVLIRRIRLPRRPWSG